jgi:hypothetical protein
VITPDAVAERARLVAKYGEAVVRAIEIDAEEQAERLMRGTGTGEPRGILANPPKPVGPPNRLVREVFGVV